MFWCLPAVSSCQQLFKSCLTTVPSKYIPIKLKIGTQPRFMTLKIILEFKNM